MRKSVWFAPVIFLAIILVSNLASAQEAGVKGSATFQTTWSNTQVGQKSNAQEALVFGSLDKIMAGAEAYRSKDYHRVRPLVGFDAGAWSLYLGGSFDSSGSQAVFPGINLSGSWKDLSVFFSGRQYFEVRGCQGDFTDLFLKLKHPIGSGFFAGVELAGDYYWKSGDSWFLVGPFLGYDISDRVSIFLRPSRDWTFSGGESRYNDGLRIGLTLNF